MATRKPGSRSRAPDEVDVHVATRIRLRRKQLGITQEVMAEGLGVTFQQVQKYERGHNRIGAGRLHRIAELLGVSVGYFFDDFEAAKGDGAAGLPVQQVLSGREVERVIAAFGSISDRDLREKCLILIRALGRKRVESGGIPPPT